MEADSGSPYDLRRLKQKGTMLRITALVKKLIIVFAVTFLLFLLLNLIFPLKVQIEYSQTITDVDGEVVNSYLTRDEKWRMLSTPDEITPLMRKTILAKEDRYFYIHPGINPAAVVRAGFKNMVSLKRTSGASTITMQVARALEHRKRSFPSKIIEMFRALQLEWKYSKEEILMMYLNLVPYGGNIEGIKAASWLYFGKNPDHLSLAEVVSLSIIPNRPSSLVIGKTNELIVTERNRWLRKFRADGIFKEHEIEDALHEPLTAKRNSVPRFIPHLSQKLKQTVNSSIIQTYIITDRQQKIEKLTGDYIRSLSMKNIGNAAVVVIDNKTHSVISYIGSADFTDTTDHGQVNGAAAIRQPGSTLKPLLYGLCMDEGMFTPKSVVLDVPLSYGGYSPENYDRNFNGQVSIEYALEHSLNIPAVKSLELFSVDKLIATLVSCDFRQIRKDREKLGLSMILGGCGATLEELTGLFSIFANNGVYHSPKMTKGAPSKSLRVMSEAASWMITDILSKVNRPDFPLAWSATEHMPKIAWKTGTSYGRRDAWSIGYNKNYTIGVWVGNFSGAGVPELSGANTATPLLFRIFNTLDYDSDVAWYSPPAGVSERVVCSETGLVPGVYCTDLITDHFIPLVSSSKPCNHIRDEKISADGKYSYCESCAPATGYTRKKYKRLSAEMEEYYRSRNVAFEKTPPHNPECDRIFRGDGPRIYSPKNNTEYFISLKDPEPIELRALAGDGVSYLYWYINDRFYKKTRPGEKQFMIPDDGINKISCTDDKGRNRDIRITVRKIDY